MSADSYMHTIDVRFRDLDPRGHANHAVYISYCEQAKAAPFEEVLTLPLTDAPTVVRSLDIEYERAVELGDRLTVAIDVGHLGRTSCPLKYDLAVGGERATIVRTTPVPLDSEGIPEPLPDSWRERLEPYHDEV